MRVNAENQEEIGEVSVTLSNVQADKEVQIATTVVNNNTTGELVQIKLEQQDAQGAWILLSSTTVASNADVVLSGTTNGTGALKVSYSSLGAFFDVHSFHYQRQDVYASTSTRLVCSNDGDDYRFGFTGHEKDNEIAGIGNSINMGARMLDTRLGRTTSPDPHAQKYPYISPYSYCLNSPIQAKDPDGKDVYLAVWFTSNGEVGHAAIAVDNYKAVTERVKINGKMVTKTTMKPDGTVTYYDFWPGEGAGKKNFNESQKGVIQSTSVTLDNLKNKDIGIGEKRPAEGLIRLKADYQATQNVQKYAQTQYDNQEANKVQYNGATQNCSNFALDCMSQLYSFSPSFGVENLNTDGNKWLLIPSTNTNSVTPNFLFKSTSDLVKGSPNKGEVLKTDATKEGKDFVNEATKGHAEDKTPGK